MSTFLVTAMSNSCNTNKRDISSWDDHHCHANNSNNYKRQRMHLPSVTPPPTPVATHTTTSAPVQSNDAIQPGLRNMLMLPPAEMNYAESMDVCDDHRDKSTLVVGDGKVEYDFPQHSRNYYHNGGKRTPSPSTVNNTMTNESLPATTDTMFAHGYYAHPHEHRLPWLPWEREGEVERGSKKSILHIKLTSLFQTKYFHSKHKRLISNAAGGKKSNLLFFKTRA